VDVDSARALVRTRLEELANAERVRDIEIGLIWHGEAVLHEVIGAGALGRQFRIASMTKSFTAATILALRDRGVLALDDHVSSYLPQLRRVGLPDDAPALRIRHLLTMTAGFPTDDPWGDRQEGLPVDDFDEFGAIGFSVCRVPGLDFEYSNLGYALLGRVISAATGQPYTDVVRDTILYPLELTSTTYDVAKTTNRVVGWHPLAAEQVEQVEPSPGAFSPMGGLWSTVPDLVQWVKFLSSAWRLEPIEGPLDPWSRREMQSPQTFARLEAGGDGCVTQSYGMGLYVAESSQHGRFIHHSGGYPGFGSHMRWHPQSGWGIVALANRTYAPMGKACAALLDEIVSETAADDFENVLGTLWPETAAAMNLAESLLNQWNDSALDEIASMNLDLDQPRSERQAHWQELTALGPFVRGSVSSASPAHARWTMSGDRGDVRIEVLMSPESPPRLQALRIEDLNSGGG
jgi:CubicO group peptidase (beta-lactamase class C family)